MAIMSIQAMKGVGIGDGFDLAGRVGSQAHDEIFYSEEQGFFRETNRAGGLEGGMTTGDPLVVRGAMKPLPTLTKPLRSVDLETKEPAAALRERTDSCTVPAAAVVAEAMVALVLAGGYREKFGGDHIDDALAALRRLQGADRMEALTDARSGLHRLHGGRQVQLRALGGRRAGARAAGLRPRAGGRAGRADRGVLRPRGRAGVPRARGGGGAAPARARRRRRGGPGRRRARSPSACARRCAAHTVVHLEVEPERGVAARHGQGPPAGPRPRPLRPAARRPRRASTTRSPTP